MRTLFVWISLFCLAALPPASAEDKPKPAPEAKPAAAEPEPKTQADETEDVKSAIPDTAGAPAAKSKASAFKSDWTDASPDEKAAFLEIYGESRDFVQKEWDKASPEQRKRALAGHPLLGARSLKHHWVSATPEERAAFLEAHPKTAAKVKKGWDEASPEQRRTLSKEHPYAARKAFYHNWMEATPQEKIAFLEALPKLRGDLRGRWLNATRSQKEWYLNNYPGLGVLADGKTWAQASVEERAAFLEANPAISEKAREAWQKTGPEARAEMARRWSGWPLRPAAPKSAKPAKAARTNPPSGRNKGKKAMTP